MIQAFVDAFMGAKPTLREQFTHHRPDSYTDIVKAVVSVLADSDDYDTPDADRIHEIDDGDYQGTLVYIIAAAGYQPFNYWYVKVGYGSCSGCDTLQAIRGYSDYDEPPSDKELDGYMTLALHVVQGLKRMGDDAA